MSQILILLFFPLNCTHRSILPAPWRTKKATLQCMWNPIKLKHLRLCCCVWSIHPMGFLNIQTFEFTPSKHFCDSTFCEFPFFTSGQKIACIFTHHVRFWWLKEYSVILIKSFYNINQQILRKNGYFQNFSWFWFSVCKLCMIMYISTAQ